MMEASKAACRFRVVDPGKRAQTPSSPIPIRFGSIPTLPTACG